MERPDRPNLRNPRRARFPRCSTLTIVMALVAAAAITAGCDECGPAGSTHCEGNTVFTCDWGNDVSPLRWRQSPCHVACVMARTGAMCADAALPIDECVKDVGSTCWGNRVTTCREGFPTDSSPPCPTATHCIAAPASEAFCGVGVAPDPRCADEPNGFCEGGILSSCRGGYVEFRADCGGPDRCRTIAHETHCTRDARPDPRCGDPSHKSAGFCSDNNAVSCWWGYDVGFLGCGPTRCFIEPDGTAGCQF